MRNEQCHFAIKVGNHRIFVGYLFNNNPLTDGAIEYSSLFMKIIQKSSLAGKVHF